jgi:hypothetical protein
MPHAAPFPGALQQAWKVPARNLADRADVQLLQVLRSSLRLSSRIRGLDTDPGPQSQLACERLSNKLLLIECRWGAKDTLNEPVLLMEEAVLHSFPCIQITGARPVNQPLEVAPTKGLGHPSH